MVRCLGISKFRGLDIDPFRIGVVILINFMGTQWWTYVLWPFRGYGMQWRTLWHSPCSQDLKMTQKDAIFELLENRIGNRMVI